MRATNTVMSCVLLAGMAAAFNPDEIDKVDIIVDYTDDSKDFTFRMDDQDVEASFALQPGTFIIKVQGWLTNKEDQEDGKAFYGASAQESVSGAETSPISIAITVLDQEVYDNPNDQSDNATPIIVSVSVSPTIIRAGQSTTMTFTSIDPNFGELPGSYTLSMGGDLSSFTRVKGSVGATDRECGTGEICGIEYEASTGDYGNLPFTMTVADAIDGSLQDEVSGNVAIDSTGAVVLNANVYHIPEILDDTVTKDTQVVNYGSGNTATITVPVEDYDLGSTLESQSDITLTYTISPLRTFLEDAEGVNCTAGDAGCQKGIACSADDVSVTSGPGDSTSKKEFQITWAPWDTNTDPMSDYGETWCTFTFNAIDSKSLVSQETTVILAAIGTATSGGQFTKLPLFEVIAVETYSPTVNDEVEFLVFMRDPDSTFDLEIDQSAVSNTASQSFTMDDASCTTQCNQTFSIAFDKSGLVTPATYIVTLKLTDATDPNLVDERDLSFTVQSSARRRGRRSLREQGLVRRAASGGSQRFEFHYEDGTMKVEKGFSSSGDGEEAAKETAGSSAMGAGIIAGLAVGAAVALIAVGVAVQRLRSAKKSGQANVNIDMSYDEEFAASSKDSAVSHVV